VFDTSGDITYKSFSLANPQRFVVDFKNASAAFDPAPIAVNDAVVKQVRFGQFSPKVFRVVCDLVQPVEATIFVPDQFKGKPGRVVLDLFRPELRIQSEENRQRIGRELEHKKIVVIDPGHGGEDPGAIGPGGTYEKDIVLQFSRSLREHFNEREDCEAFLTRYGDYFLSLRERTQIAEDYGADLFVSIHTDSNRDRKLRGSSVYCLSLKGASDEATRCLAEEENAADLIGGIPFSSNDDLNFMLLDLALTNTINSSLCFGSLVLREIGKVHTVKFDRPKQAGFVILKTPEIPALLVELGFLSNAAEERAFKQDKFRLSVSKAIVQASDEFFSRMDQKNGAHNCSVRKSETKAEISMAQSSNPGQ
jgi:N-acetylmuramoyl-L-alanine amidase